MSVKRVIEAFITALLLVNILYAVEMDTVEDLRLVAISGAVLGLIGWAMVLSAFKIQDRVKSLLMENDVLLHNLEEVRAKIEQERAKSC